MPSGYTSSLPSDVLLDAAVLYINGSTPAGVFLNPRFDPGTERENIPFPGKRAPVMGLDRTVGWLPKISGAFLQFGTTDVARLEPGSTSATASGTTTITPNPAGELLASGDYLTNVRLVYKRGSGGFAWVRFPKALITKWGLEPGERTAATIPVEIEARQDLSSDTNTEVAPFVIEYASSV